MNNSGVLDAATLGRTDAVVRDRGHILNGSDADAKRVERTHRRFAARTRAPNANFDVLQTMFDRDLAGDVRGYLSSKRSRLARALEALRTRRRGRNSVALTVGDGNNRVVERRVNVGDALCLLYTSDAADEL